MSLSGSGLANLTFTGHVALFPPAATVSRSNSDTGVTPHNPAQKLIEGLANGLVDTVTSLTWKGTLPGTAMPGGVAAPFLFTVPGATAAAATFLASSGWVGLSSALFSQSVIQNMLLNLSVLGLIYGDPSKTVGIGTAVFSIATNPDVYAAAQGSLMATLPLALQATNVFGQEDVPGAPINADLAKTIPSYAAAYAQGLSTLLASVPYLGGASSSGSTDLVTGGVS